MRIITILLVIATITSCKTKKEAATSAVVKMTEKTIAIQNCYTQKEIAGEEAMPPRQDIYIILKSTSPQVTLDSIKFAAATYPMAKYGKQYKAKLDPFSTAKTAEVYYTENDKPYFSNIKSIEVKEDIYLPSVNPEEEH
jgi:hypothetical protein